MVELPSVVEAINDLTSRIERLENSENALEISSIVLRLDYITRMHVNLEVPDEIVNTIRGLYESVVQLEANHNVVEGDGYAAQYFALGPVEGLLMKYRGNNCLSYWTKGSRYRKSAVCWELVRGLSRGECRRLD